MVKNVHYPNAKAGPGQSFAGEKRMTVPRQSMSLREIVARYVRREPIMVNSREGVYEHRFGDLEKMSKLDIFEQHEIIDELKLKIAQFEEREKARVQKEKEENEKKVSEEFERRVAEGIAKGKAGQTAPVAGSPPVS